LTAVELGVDSWLCQESGVRAALHDSSVLHHKNLVCLEDRGEAMGDDDRGAAGKGGFERALDGGFKTGMDRRNGRVRLRDKSGELAPLRGRAS